MKVRDLLENLKDADPESEVSFSMPDGCCGDREWLDINEIYVRDGDETQHEKPLVEFLFKGLSYFSTCRKSGAVKDAAKAYDKAREDFINGNKGD